MHNRVSEFDSFSGLLPDIALSALLIQGSYDVTVPPVMGKAAYG